MISVILFVRFAAISFACSCWRLDELSKIFEYMAVRDNFSNYPIGPCYIFGYTEIEIHFW